jgi:hypothetical protein
MTDDELVTSTIGPYTPAPDAWLCEWGSAVIDGRPVFVFMTDYLNRAVYFAGDWRIGVTFMEPCARFHDEFRVGYFFERGRRPVSDDVAEAGLERSLAAASA